MKILMVAASMPQAGEKPGGVSVVISELAKALKQRGHEIWIASNSAPPKGTEVSYLPIISCLSNFFSKYPRITKNRFVTLVLTPIALNFFDSRSFDVLILNGDDWFYFLRRKPTLRILHGSALREAQYAQSFARKILQYIVYPLEKLSSLLATRSVAIGEDTRRIYPRSHCIIPNGLDNKIFFVGNEKAQLPLLLFVGTWSGRKRGSFLYSEFKEKILKAHPDAELHMLVDKEINDLNVRTYRYLSSSELGSLYRKAWIFAYPSLYEGFGIPYIEAMASGTYVVASPCAASNALIDNASKGQVAEDAIFAQTIISKLSDFKSKGFNEVDRTLASQYSWENIAKLYERQLIEITEAAKS